MRSQNFQRAQAERKPMLCELEEEMSNITNVALGFACPVCYGIGWVGWCLLAGSPVL